MKTELRDQSNTVAAIAEGALRVWWIPQVPMDPFYVYVGNINVDVSALDRAKLLLTTLAAYDQFQLANNIKPDCCNAGGLEVHEDGEWVEWHNVDDEDIDTIMARDGF